MEQKEKYSEKVTEAYNTLAKFVVYGARGQPPLWPFSIIETNWYYTHFFAREIYHTITGLQKKGIADQKIAELCWGPSAISHWFYIIEPAFGVPGLNPFQGLDKHEGIEFIEKTVDILSLQRKGDKFCRDGKNLLLSASEVKQVLDGREFLETKRNLNAAKSIRQLTMTLWQYAILIQCGHRAYSQEFHGPYNLDKNQQLLIKDYFWLKPGSNGNLIWDFSSDLPYEKLKVLEIYENSQIEIDLFNHYNVSGYPIKFSVINEDADLSEKEINKLLTTSLKVMSEGNKTIEKFSKSDWVKKLIDLRYLWLKPHKDILGQDWRPPEEIYKLTKRTDEAYKAAVEFEKKIYPLVRTLSPEELVEAVTKSLVEIIY